MFCPKCGNELVESAKFCDKCGTQVKQNSIAPSKNNILLQMLDAVKKNCKDLIQKGNKKVLLAGGAVSVLAIILVIAFISHLNSKPYIYQTAITCMENKNYAKAEKKFLKIIDYEDSEQKLAVVWYNYALECMEEEKYDRALELIEKYESSPVGAVASSDIKQRLQEYKYEIANVYRDSESYEDAARLYELLGKTWEAAEVYAAMGNYRQAIEITSGDNHNGDQIAKLQTWYREQALLSFGEKEYEEAVECLAAYDKTYDSEMSQCVYEIINNYAKNKKYGESIRVAEELITKLVEDDREIVNVLLNQCYESQVILYVEEGKIEEAWEYFQRCNITETMQPYLYKIGQYYQEQGSYLIAIEVWEKLGEYQDSHEQMLECCLQQGGVYEEQHNFVSAIEMYRAYGDESRVTECMYNWAYYDYSNKDYESAAQMFSQLGDYEDSLQYLELINRSLEKEEIEGTWRSMDGNLIINCLFVGGSGVHLRFTLDTKTYKVMNTPVYLAKNGIKLENFDQADKAGFLGGSLWGCEFYEGHWNYTGGVLYLGSESPKEFDCIISNNKMQLTVEDQTFILAKTE